MKRFNRSPGNLPANPPPLPSRNRQPSSSAGRPVDVAAGAAQLLKVCAGTRLFVQLGAVHIEEPVEWLADTPWRARCVVRRGELWAARRTGWITLRGTPDGARAWLVPAAAPERVRRWLEHAARLLERAAAALRRHARRTMAANVVRS